ncbi:MAG: TIGR03936 family radical SAM-associated protein, partial [Acidimicrobiales bacterium]
MRVRARFSKLGKVSWTSHRDVARMWERALRRAGLPVAYTQGFSPRPRLSFGLALPTGHCSVAEYLDIDLNEEVASGYELARTLSQVLPTGVDVLGCAVVDAGRESLQSEVTSCTWTIEVVGMDPDTLAGVATSGMECETIPVTRERKGRQTTDDLRPAILALRKGGWDGPAGVFDDEESLLTVELETGQRGVRPF